MRLSSDLWTSFWCSHSPPQSGSCEIVHQACWTGRKNQSRLPAQLNLPILVGTVDLHRPSGAAQLNAAAAPSGYLFESPSQTRLCIVALLTKLPEDTRTLDLAAKGLYGPLDTVAFFDLDFTHTALLCFQSSTDKPKKKDRPKGQVLSYSPASALEWRSAPPNFTQTRPVCQTTCPPARTATRAAGEAD